MASTLRLGAMPEFPEFYEALNGRPPFPWQSRLAVQVSESGRWPTEIGVPTGLGKTSCLDIAIWWLASQAELSPTERAAPTRIWWLVNRRLLVDSTAEHAIGVSNALEKGDVESLRIVGNRLRSLAARPGTRSPLEVIRLRGGVEVRRPVDPSSPAVILSTIPMYGSRLLFRGYGTTRTMRPIDAALAGSDSLLLLDEAHLAQHLTSLISSLADCTQSGEQILGGHRSRPQLVALTATGDASAEDRFNLDSDDEAIAIVRQRLDANKPLTLRVRPRTCTKHMAEAVDELLRGNKPSSCLVFANSPDTAREVLTLVRKLFPASDADTTLLTGRSREREAERIRARILDGAKGMAAGRNPSEMRSRHLIVVATQTLEVGADIDAEFMVTEQCGVRALTQRLGRLNRLGNYEHARAVYVHVPPQGRGARTRSGPTQWPVYGPEPKHVLERLKRATDSATGSVNLSPRVVSEVLGDPADDPGRAPEILPGLLWEWVKTTTPPRGEAPVEAYFSGISGTDYQVSVIWRAHVPEDGDRVWPRPYSREVVNVPISEIRSALSEDGEVKRLKDDQITVETTRPQHLHPGDIILLPSDKGMLDEFGWNPKAIDPVFDMSVVDRGLPLDEEAIQRLGVATLAEPVNTASGPVSLRRLLRTALGRVADDESVSESERMEAAERFLDALFEITPMGWGESEWRALLEALHPRVVSLPKEVPRFPLIVKKRESRPSDEFDETSLAPASANLEIHGKDVGTLCELIANKVGLAPEVVGVIRLAGRWHDIGKADARFQCWLRSESIANSTDSAAMLAKSHMPRSLWNAARVAAGWPRGGRHEALSARLVSSWLQAVGGRYEADLADLLIHLVISHHGSGRPLIPPADDGAGTTVASEIEGIRLAATADLSRIDWEQPARFRRLNERFGPWGLALLEAILRQADHSVSRAMPIWTRRSNRD